MKSFKIKKQTTTEMTLEQKIKALKEVAEEVGGKYKSNYTGSNCHKNPCLALYVNQILPAVEACCRRGIYGAQSDFSGKSCVIFWPHLTMQSKKKVVINTISPAI